jgi:hypothetical protein
MEHPQKSAIFPEKMMTEDVWLEVAPCFLRLSRSQCFFAAQWHTMALSSSKTATNQNVFSSFTRTKQKAFTRSTPPYPSVVDQSSFQLHPPMLAATDSSCKSTDSSFLDGGGCFGQHGCDIPCGAYQPTALQNKALP